MSEARDERSLGASHPREDGEGEEGEGEEGEVVFEETDVVTEAYGWL